MLTEQVKTMLFGVSWECTVIKNNLIVGHFRIKDEDLHFLLLYHAFSYIIGKIYQNPDFLAHISKKLYLYPLFVKLIQNHPKYSLLQSNEITNGHICKFCTSASNGLKAIIEN